MDTLIRLAEKPDLPAVAALARTMWDHDAAELAEEFEALLGNADAALFVVAEDGAVIGFAQCQLRHDYVEGTDTSPVGYLEGICVREPYRCRGYARALLYACEEWAREKGCTQFASDCELTNADSLAFHLSLGFTEANRVICFTKEL